jgi:hypothetical protein
VGSLNIVATGNQRMPASAVILVLFVRRARDADGFWRSDRELNPLAGDFRDLNLNPKLRDEQPLPSPSLLDEPGDLLRA